MVPLIPTKDTLYKKRNLIENTFAKIKLLFGDKENTKSPALAKKFILMKLLLLNFATFIATFIFCFFIFQTVSFQLLTF